MVNSHSELGTKSPTQAAFEELALAEGRDVETVKKYFQIGVRECRPHETRTAMQIHALIQNLARKGIADPQQAALEQFAKDLGKTPLIMRRIYARGRKPGK
jgi:methylphosphotriester-DNA--protein-cysteine methyltransferase